VQVKAALELARRLSGAAGRPGTRYQSSEDIFREYHPRLKHLKQEVFIVVLLDVKNRRIRDVTVSQGSLTEAIVHPREVFIPVLRESAASIVLVHNHPSGDPSPSMADLDLTRRLQATAEMMGVCILDHLIIGRDGYASFVDRGLLKPKRIP
jgi:DNA repair protein RadC